MSGDPMSPPTLSRRWFLKASCIAAAGVGAAVCGGAGLVAALRPDPPAIDWPSFAYGEPTGDKVLIAYASATGSTVDIAAAHRSNAWRARLCRGRPPGSG